MEAVDTVKKHKLQTQMDLGSKPTSDWVTHIIINQPQTSYITSLYLIFLPEK